MLQRTGQIVIPKFAQIIAYRNCCKMQRAVLRYCEGNTHFDFSFLFEKSDLNISRRFNFNRNVTESVQEFLSRISSNVEKTVKKKHNRKKKKKKEDQEDINPVVTADLLQNGESVPKEALCKDLLLSQNVVLKILENEYIVDINPPWITLVTLPNSILAGFPVYPCKLEMEFADKKDSAFEWFRGVSENQDSPGSSGQVQWIKVGSDFFYTPAVEDIGCQLKLVCIPGKDTRKGPSVETVSSSPVQAGPGKCPFETRHVFTSEKLLGNSFRIMTYNILADLYADSDFSRTVLYPYCPPYALAVDYRKQLVLKELIGYNADIICLQEVDSKVFNFDLIPVLSVLGYDGIFDKKGGQVSEGLACLFRTDRFRLVESSNIILAEELSTNPLFATIWSQVQGNEALVKRLQDRTTSVQSVVLESLDNPTELLVVGITHLYFHPDADHIRLTQAGMGLLYLEQVIAMQLSKNPNKRLSLILCGDFNSTPEFGVYQLMTTQHIPEGHMDFSSNKEEAVKGLSFAHQFQLASACGTPECTNFTVGFAGCLDYIFYQTDSLEVKQVVPLPSTEELQQHTALPSVVSPSDHLALIADLSWKANTATDASD